MNIYALINRYGQENDNEPFSPSEAALYLNLLYKANCRHWQMPIRCPTSKLSIEINVSRQAVIDAREKLKARGLIDYTPGYGKVEAPSYTLIGLTGKLTDDLTDNLTGNLTDGLTDSLTIYNIKDKDNLNHNNRACEEKLSLDELRQRLSTDAEWLTNIHSLLSKQFPIAPADVQTKLSEFFEYLRCHGFKEREESDCRRYFFNWLKKQLTNQNNNSNNNEHPKQQPDLRRSSAITASSAKDYEGAF
jgi:DNA-binding Lrp family transcriptional regulator